jgi:hypothetical protein
MEWNYALRSCSLSSHLAAQTMYTHKFPQRIWMHKRHELEAEEEAYRMQCIGHVLE